MHEGPGGREILKYLATCALPADVSLAFDTMSAGSFEYPGTFGLAPSWESAPLAGVERELITACLLAHVNAYGVSVPISVRNPISIGADDVEQEAFPILEGAFFGEALSPEPKYFACTGERDTLAKTLSESRDLRACTDSTPDCRIAVVGRCFEVCETYDPGLGWSDCWADGVRYAGTTTVYLQTTAGRLGCDGAEPCAPAGDRAVIDAAGAARVEPSCSGATCAIDCTATAECSSACDGGQCSVDCSDSDRCALACSGGSDCELSCRGATDCTEVKCTGGSACLLDCNGAGDCGFARCSGGETNCGGGIVVCNRDCPEPPTPGADAPEIAEPLSANKASLR
jgi:hypothetical protein